MTTTSRTGVTTFTTPSDLEIVATRVFEAPRELVFDAWTSPEHLPHWMLGPTGWTMPVCEIDLRPGGAWRFVWRKDDGSEMAMHGIYDEVIPVTFGRDSQAYLSTQKARLTYQEYPIGHGISEESLYDLSDWLSRELEC